MRNKSESRKKAEKLIENILKQKEIKIKDWSQDSHDHWLGCFYILDINDDITITVQERDYSSEIMFHIKNNIPPNVLLTLFKGSDNYIGYDNDLESETENMIKALRENGLDFLLEGVEDE